MTSNLGKAVQEKFQVNASVPADMRTYYSHAELEALLTVVQEEARKEGCDEAMADFTRARVYEAERDAAEGLLANLAHAVRQSKETDSDEIYDAMKGLDDLPRVEAWRERLALITEQETRAPEAAEALLANLVFAVEQANAAAECELEGTECQEALRKALLAASSDDKVFSWKEHLYRVAEQESNIDFICKNAEKTRNLLDSTRIELELVVKRLVDRLRSRATSEQVTADRYRDLAMRDALPDPNEEYRLRDRHEHAASVLTEEVAFLEAITGDTIVRAKAFVEAKTK